MKSISIKDFGKDHWSLLAYCEYRAVNYHGVLDQSHLRCKNPTLSVLPGHTPWKPEYGTRLSGYWNKNGKTNKNRLLPEHDDLDCLDDLEVAGLLENVGTMINPYAELTDKGRRVAALLSAHKQADGQFADFQYKEEKQI